MSMSVCVRPGRVSRSGWVGPVLFLTSAVCVAALLAMALLATENLLVSIAHRPRALDDWRQPARIVEARRQTPARREAVAAVPVLTLPELPSETYSRAAARDGDEALADLRARLAEAPLMYDSDRSAWRSASLRTGAMAESGLLTASVAAPKLATTRPRFDVAFEKAKPVIAVTKAPVLASLTPPAAEVAKAEEAAPRAPVAVEVAEIPLPPIAPLPPVAAPVMAAVEAAPIPMPTPRPADFASMARARPIVPVKLDSATDQAVPLPKPTALAYATPDLEPKKSGVGAFFDSLLDRGVAAQLPSRGSGIAVYDISSATVRLPNGEKLEAHSGLAHRQDNPAYVREKNRGPTPPNFYDLRMREALFHGAAAIRLTPRYQAKVFNRDGLLAHPYMYVGGGGRQQSNGCVVFKDYARFLRAFRSGEVRHLVVVSTMSDLPTMMAGL